ncbi:MAG TPA: hypothetical protein DCZ69_13430 [Syntrophobacteraceae bacterium]|jgi:hypothetical protein|nr:hypothetical protein [Syntrophobacteraceae bacterium]HBZ56952.1 hypothetical protein [Syntrophobacteraceae bacterium]
MKRHKILIGLALGLILLSTIGLAVAQQFERMQPPSPMHRQGALTGICGDQEFLYVMASGKIMRYGTADLKLQKTIDLPERTPPGGGPPMGSDSGQMPPSSPPMPMPHGLWTGNGFLYVLAGPVIYKFRTPDLTLQTSVEIPRPDFSGAGK